MVESGGRTFTRIGQEDRGRNILSLLRQPNFIDYYHHIDDAPDGLK